MIGPHQAIAALEEFSMRTREFVAIAAHVAAADLHFARKGVCPGDDDSTYSASTLRSMRSLCPDAYLETFDKTVLWVFEADEWRDWYAKAVTRPEEVSS
jgi:hypothetical protein